MSKVRHVRFHPDEYIVGVSGLPAEQQGVFWMVCSLVMSHGGPIPADYDRIGRLTSIRPSKAKRLCEALIACGKLTETDGKLSQKRAESEVKSAQNLSKNARENGQNSGGRPRENNDLENPAGFETEKLTNNHKPVTNNQNIPLKPPKGSDPEFEEFYAACPKRRDRGKAERAYRTARKTADHATLMASIRRYAESVAGKDPQFVKYPSSWLNAKSWLDDETVVPFEPPRGRVVF